MCPRIARGFFIWGQKLSVWMSVVIFTVSALELRKREAYRKQTGSNLSVFSNKISGAWAINAGFTAHCLMIICKYLRLSHKRVYQRSVLNTYQLDQITGRNDDYSIGIPRANLELKHVSIIYSHPYHNMLIKWS